MHIESQTEWEERMGKKIIFYLREELQRDFPFLDLALGSLSPKQADYGDAFATNGVWLYFKGDHLISLFQTNELFLTRMYLHSILHCIYGHLWLQQNRDRMQWHLACDMAVEHLIDGFQKTSTKRILTLTRKHWYEKMEEKKILSAQQIYQLLEDTRLDWIAEGKDVSLLFGKLRREFFADDHRLWPMQEQGRVPRPREEEIKKKWEKNAIQMKLRQEREEKQASDEEQAVEEFLSFQRKQRNYHDFLMKFAEVKEERKLNLDEWDLSMYLYGLSHYGNLPLLEPLETMEKPGLRDFVIAIDTSYSTKGELVKSFLRESLEILYSREDFLQIAKIYILQCDDRVQDVQCFQKDSDYEKILDSYSWKGGGNTDFRPVFQWIAEERKKGFLREISGLVYFTDGKGIYPKSAPDYPVSFLFLEAYEKEQVPKWAMNYEIGKDVVIG